MKYFQRLLGFFFVAIILHCCHGYPTNSGDSPRGDPGKRLSYSPHADTLRNFGGKNLLIPKKTAGNMEHIGLSPPLIPVHRAEASHNQHFNSDGIIRKSTGKKAEPSVFVAIGDEKRTVEYSQQKRVADLNTQNARGMEELYRRNVSPSGRNGPLPSNVQTFLNGVKFNANDLTIRSGGISQDFAREIITNSALEANSKNKVQPAPPKYPTADTYSQHIRRTLYQEIPSTSTQTKAGNFARIALNQALQKKPDILNVDTSKGANQFGVRGETLETLRAEIAKNPRTEGVYLGNRRNSMPVLPEYQWRGQKAPSTLPRNAPRRNSTPGLGAAQRPRQENRRHSIHG